MPFSQSSGNVGTWRKHIAFAPYDIRDHVQHLALVMAFQRSAHLPFGDESTGIYHEPPQKLVRFVPLVRGERTLKSLPHMQPKCNDAAQK